MCIRRATYIMDKRAKQDASSKLDTKEFNLPDTIFSRDIENRVFQGIIIKSLSDVTGIGLIDGSFFDTLIGRLDRVKGIYTEQDQASHSLKIRIELNVSYGISIPEKAEEVQAKVIEAITRLTGMRVSEVHVIFKELITKDEAFSKNKKERKAIAPPEDINRAVQNEFEENYF